MQIYGFKCLPATIVVSKMVTVEHGRTAAKPLLEGLVLLLTSVAPLLWAQRPDVVVMKNGDRFSCTVNKLQQGLLYIETDYFSGRSGSTGRR